MRSKPKNTCGFCTDPCNQPHCPTINVESYTEKEFPCPVIEEAKKIPYVVPLKYVTKEELEKIYPRARLNSEQFLYDLIKNYGGIRD